MAKGSAKKNSKSSIKAAFNTTASSHANETTQEETTAQNALTLVRRTITLSTDLDTLINDAVTKKKTGGQRHASRSSEIESILRAHFKN